MDDRAKPKQQVMRFVRLIETSVGEINVLSLPIFRLGSNAARPIAGKDAGGRDLLRREDYRIERDLGGGQRLVMEADMHHGFPTLTALRVLLAILDEARLMGYTSRRIPITIAAIASWMGMTTVGGSQVEMILQQGRSLAGLKLRFFECWYDKASKAHVSTENAYLAEQLEVAKKALEAAADRCAVERSSPAAFAELEKANGRYEELVTAYSAHAPLDPSTKKPKESWDRIITEFQLGEGTENFVELGQRLFDSLSRKYRVGLDRGYLLALDRPLAQRLYTYLAKEDGKRADGSRQPVYRENLLSLGQRLPLAVEEPAQIRQNLEPALKALVAEQAGGKRYLRSYKFVGRGRRTVLEVQFATGAEASTPAMVLPEGLEPVAQSVWLSAMERIEGRAAERLSPDTSPKVREDARATTRKLLQRIQLAGRHAGKVYLQASSQFDRDFLADHLNADLVAELGEVVWAVAPSV